MTITNLKEAQQATRIIGFGNLNRGWRSEEKTVYLSYNADHDEGEVKIEIETGNMRPVYNNPAIVTVGYSEQVSMKEILEDISEEVKKYRAK